MSGCPATAEIFTPGWISDFSDLLDVLDTAIQIHAEAGKGSWGGFGDLTYIETSDTTNRPLLSIDTINSVAVIDLAEDAVRMERASF